MNALTYGLVWTRSLNGRELNFHLAGINNQNFIMRDKETGSYWQQVTGAAIAGPLKGEQLTLLSQDEPSFGLWKKEQPNGTVLAPLPRYAAKYEKATWESEVAKLPTVIHGTKGTILVRACLAHPPALTCWASLIDCLRAQSTSPLQIA